MHETVVKNLKVCPTVLAMLFYLRTFISYHKRDINQETEE